MWKLRGLAVLVVIAVMLFGSMAVYAGWRWNAQIQVEGVDVRTAWTVDDGIPDSDADQYHAQIRVYLPEDADAAILAEATTENVVLGESQDLECKSDGIEMEVYYRVRSLQPVGDPVVAVTILASGVYVDSATGHLGETIKLQVLVPADNPSC